MAKKEKAANLLQIVAERGMKPGTLLQVKADTTGFINFSNDVNAQGVASFTIARNEAWTREELQRSRKRICVLFENDILMFIDVVVDPLEKRYLFRFLRNEKIVATTHTNGETLGLLKALLEVVGRPENNEQQTKSTE